MAKGKRITDAEVQAYLARASNHKGGTGMVADGIRLIERLIAENQGLQCVHLWEHIGFKHLQVGSAIFWCQLCGGRKRRGEGNRWCYSFPKPSEVRDGD